MKTFGKTRRDPQKGKKEFSTHRGFTLIELMVVIAIVAIITSFALPSYRTLLEKRQVTSGAHQISAFLSSAKMEAVKRNEKVAISTFVDANEWCMGYVAYDANEVDDDAACDCKLTIPTAAGACAVDDFGDGTMVLRVLRNTQPDNWPSPDLVNKPDHLNKPVEITSIDLGGGDNVVIFDPIRGMLVADDTVAMPLEMKMLSKQEAYGLNVQLTVTGRVTVCSDTSTAVYPVPGYDECQVN
jgi:prepilin-type N-terminal cleavage/methylation domain-containing protein